MWREIICYAHQQNLAITQTKIPFDDDHGRMEPSWRWPTLEFLNGNRHEAQALCLFFFPFFFRSNQTLFFVFNYLLFVYREAEFLPTAFKIHELKGVCSQFSASAMKKQSSKNSEASPHVDSPHSPLRFQSPLRSEQGDPPESPEFRSPENSPDNSKAIVAVSKVTQCSPARSAVPPSDRQKAPENAPPARPPASMVMINRAMRDEPPPSVTKVGPASGVARAADGGHGRSRSAEWSKREEMLRKAALGFRFSEVLLCLISFSVMAADKTQGWSGDSFDRYKEYRYCLSVNVIAFVYSGFQACDLAYQLVTGKNMINHHLRCHFDFFMDQILAYLLISASSSAATRVDDWQSNWGKDKFTEMASASVGMSFLAFIAFAFSSLISGYNLCARSSI